jgi:hypothetical protein
MLILQERVRDPGSGSLHPYWCEMNDVVNLIAVDSFGNQEFLIPVKTSEGNVTGERCWKELPCIFWSAPSWNLWIVPQFLGFAYPLLLRTET